MLIIISIIISRRTFFWLTTPSLSLEVASIKHPLLLLLSLSLSSDAGDELTWSTAAATATRQLFFKSKSRQPAAADVPRTISPASGAALSSVCVSRYNCAKSIDLHFFFLCRANADANSARRRRTNCISLVPANETSALRRRRRRRRLVAATFGHKRQPQASREPLTVRDKT